MRIEPWKRNLWVLWGAVLIASSSYTLSVPFLPLYLMELGVPETQLELWAAVSFSITFLIGALLAPYWGARADREGRRRMIIRAGLSLAVVYFLGGLVQNEWMLLGVRVLHGIASGFIPGAFALVSTNMPEEKMGYSLGLLQTAGATGGILGPLFGGMLSHAFGIRMAFFCAGWIILLATLLVWKFVTEEKKGTGKAKGNIWADVRRAWTHRQLLYVLSITLVVQMSVMAIEPLLTLYIADLQGAEGAALAAGFVFSVGGVATILAAPVFGRIGQKIGYRRILFPALFLAGVLTAAQMWTDGIWTLTVVRFVTGLSIAGVMLAVNASIVEHTDAQFRGRAFGLSTSANHLGLMIGPLFGGVLGGVLPIQGVFLITGVVLCGWAVFAAVRTRTKYVPVPGHSSTPNPNLPS